MFTKKLMKLLRERKKLLFLIKSTSFFRKGKKCRNNPKKKIKNVNKM